ncbi:MAG TPA: ABC transporter permease [Epulopiscium sp.]|nr:ABC transporter permease [Candidatus Epulonipiscium sp.]
MFKYILRRLGMAVITLWAIITITFVLMNAVPGDPIRSESKMPPAVYENLKEKYGLNKPYHEQYIIYLSKMARGDFGESMKSRTQTVNQMIGSGFPVSAYLGLQALIVALCFGPVLGVVASLNQNKWPDYLSMVVAILGISVPSFVLGTVLIQYVAAKSGGLLPVAGWTSFKHTILPTIALAMSPLAFTARLMRSSMLEVLNQDYIKTATSKGLARGTVIVKHAIRNAILPIVSVLGTITTNLVVGSFVVEKLFGIPGLGMYFVSSITNRDYPIIMGTTVFYAMVLIAMLLIVDIAYVLIDPRIKLMKEG